MPTILFHRPGVLPAGRLRAMLSDALPLYRWICGEDDDGTSGHTIPLRGHHLICGRGDGAPLFVELRWIDSPLTGDNIPHHAEHVTLSPPTTDNRAEGDLVIALIAQALMSQDGGGIWCRLSSDGGWMAGVSMEEITRRIAAGDTLERAGSEPHRPSPVAPRTIAPAFHTERPSLDRLPTLAVLIAPGDSGNAMPPPPDWVELEDDLHSHDPAGNWRIDPRDSHSALLTGRPGRIGIAMRGTPLPADWLQLALGRNPRLAEDTETAAELRAHSACLTLSCDLDTHAAGPDDTRQIAIAMGLTLLLLARDLHGAGRLAGLANPAHAMLFAPEQLPAFAQTLQAGDVPAPLFIGTAFHATMPGAVSLSTTGLMPFTGFEVEAWNAPGDADTIGERLASVLRHLLKQGPVLRHGDTLGGGAIRTLHGTSRAERPYAGNKPLPALWLEFGEARPYPSRPVAVPAMAAPLRRPGGFGRKGL
ncbi:DUF4261 domain-containing protein [Novosphingobium sp.]|uniref:DUF4261 domain-containing protein n=1 Tax=Novosphingobium sp. TaxID=1874826 RepID=UPI0031E23CE2